jgi:ribosomal protein S12 methylthiotransferase accessory factor
MKPQLESLLDLVSDRTGIVKSLSLRVKSADEPTIPAIYDATLSNFDFRQGDRSERGACGKGITEDDAMLGAIGEAVERYCASHPARKDTCRSTFARLVGEAVCPTDFVLYSHDQYARKHFPYRAWRSEDELLWVQMNELGASGLSWAPAALVFLGAIGDDPQNWLCGTNSSGFAAGPDVDAALRSATLELLERDAFLVTWLNRLPVPEVDFSGMSGPVRAIRSTYQRWGTDIRAFLLATDLPIFAVMAVALDRTGSGPAAMIGLGCELDLPGALQRALFEVCQLHELLRRKHEAGAAEKVIAYQDVRRLDDHAAYFFHPDHLHEFDFVLGGHTKILADGIPRAATTAKEDLRFLEGALLSRGIRLLYRDLTTPDLEQYPIRVVRALATKLQPIHFGHGLERLGGLRLYKVPKSTGFTDLTSSERTLNPCPHPLA